MKKEAEKALKKFEEFKQTKPEQMNLFEILAPEDQKYSNSIELYDFIPKYFWGKQERINGEFLRALERSFTCRGVSYKVKISPAKIQDKDGVHRDYYPSKREELVEDALRKLACEGQGLFLDDQVGVVFTLYELEQELQRIGHGYNKADIKDALLICAKTNIEVQTEDGKAVVISNLFETLGLQTREDWKGHGQKTRCFVRFNSLVTNSIRNKSFRQLNYEKSMSYKSVIARQLHKRMSHHYTQASVMNNYSIMLTTIIRDFGLTVYEKLSNNLRDVKKALKEMEEKEVVLNFKIEPVVDGQRKGKLLDAKIIIQPHFRFGSEMKRANERQRAILYPSGQPQLPGNK
ncbi:hypothetical protein HY772_01650 [Candidatus Woesearchaeota archaeon]|nr:hypothetical protein [Candidatus Woesearchaeota archaeon]